MKKRYDFRVPVELLTDLRKYYNLNDVDTTKAIHLAIRNILLNGKMSKNNSRYYFTSASDSEKINEKLSNYSLPIMSFRESERYIELLRYFYRNRSDAEYIHLEQESSYKDYYIEETRKDLTRKPKTNPIILSDAKATASDAIRSAIYDTINGTLYKQTNIQASDKIVAMLGQKNKLMNEALSKVFSSIKSNFQICHYYEPFAGTANVYLHNSVVRDNSEVYLNDINKYLVKLLGVCSNPSELIELQYIIMNDITYSKESFDKYKEELKNPTRDWTDLQRAGMQYFILYSSVMNNQRDFNKNIRDNPYSAQGTDKERLTNEKQAMLGKIHMLFKFSQKLYGVNFSSKDYSEFINDYYQIPKGLFYIDSPYWYTEKTCSEKNQFTDADHAKLANYAEKINLYNNIFVISYRVTVSETLKKGVLTNSQIIAKANNLYSGKGYYRLLVLYNKKNKQVEIIISNVPFTGATLFNEPLTEDEVACMYK